MLQLFSNYTATGAVIHFQWVFNSNNMGVTTDSIQRTKMNE
jgi:hypothetical protein